MLAKVSRAADPGFQRLGLERKGVEPALPSDEGVVGISVFEMRAKGVVLGIGDKRRFCDISDKANFASN